MKRRTGKRSRPEEIVGQAATPVYLVSADRRIIWFNAGCQALTGWTAAEIVGRTCEYVTDPTSGTPESLTASLCPPSEAFRGRIVSVPTHVACRSGEPAPRIVNFLPLLGEEAGVIAVLALMTAIDPPSHIVETGPAQALHAELAALRHALRQRYNTASLVCRSDEMIRVVEQLALARGAKSAVLLHGEPGSGKEHVARAIHHEGPTHTRSFVPLDCRRSAPLELQQTLRRIFEPSRDHSSDSVAALQPGTVYFTHVEHLPRDLQRLTVEAFRSEWGRKGDLRLMAATAADPSRLTHEDTLRSDFYQLLTPLCIAVPPLRRRAEDLPFLAQHLLEELNRGDSRQFSGFGDDVWEAFLEYNWPGNVDELQAVIREARAAATEPLIRAKDLPFRFRAGFAAQAIGPVIRAQAAPLEPMLAQAEKEQIERVLNQCRFNKSRAAELLGLTRARLYRRMEALGIVDDPGAAAPRQTVD